MSPFCSSMMAPLREEAGDRVSQLFSRQRQSSEKVVSARRAAVFSSRATKAHARRCMSLPQTVVPVTLRTMSLSSTTRGLFACSMATFILPSQTSDCGASSSGQLPVLTHATRPIREARERRRTSIFSPLGSAPSVFWLGLLISAVMDVLGSSIVRSRALAAAFILIGGCEVWLGEVMGRCCCVTTSKVRL